MKKPTLSEYKKKKKLTNKDLADLLGISETFVSYLCSGKRYLSLSIARRIYLKIGKEIDVTKLVAPDQVEFRWFVAAQEKEAI